MLDLKLIWGNRVAERPSHKKK